MEKLLYYAAGNEGREKEMEALAGKSKVDFIPVSPLQAGQQIGCLAGVKGYGEKKLSLFKLPPRLPEEMLVFSGFSGERLDVMLGLLREKGLSVSLKAVVTAHNVDWTFAALYQELTAERAAIAKQPDTRL